MFCFMELKKDKYRYTSYRFVKNISVLPYRVTDWRSDGPGISSTFFSLLKGKLSETIDWIKTLSFSWLNDGVALGSIFSRTGLVFHVMLYFIHLLHKIQPQWQCNKLRYNSFPVLERNTFHNGYFLSIRLVDLQRPSNSPTRLKLKLREGDMFWDTQ